MRRILAFTLLLTAFSVHAMGQDTVTPGTPRGWQFGGDFDKYEVGTRVLPRMPPGTQVAYLKARPEAECGDLGALFQTIAADNYRGKRVKLSARLYGNGTTFGMFVFLSGPDHTSGVYGPGWRPAIMPADRGNFRNASITIGVPANAEEITFGFRVSGPYGGMVDAVRLEVTGDYQPPPPRSAPASKAGTVGTFEGNLAKAMAVHGSCAYRYSLLIARGRFEVNERALITMARRSAPQEVQIALSGE